MHNGAVDRYLRRVDDGHCATHGRQVPLEVGDNTIGVTLLGVSCLIALAIQCLPQQVLGQQMPTATEAATAVNPPVLKRYVCLLGRQGETAEQLRAFYANRSDVQIAADSVNPQLSVFAPPDIQESISRQLAVIAGVGASRSGAGESRPETAGAEQFIQLKYIGTEQCEAVLGRLLGTRLARLANPLPGRPDYTYCDFGGRRLEIRVDRQHSALSLRGPEALTAQFLRLIQNLDSPQQEPGKALRIVPVRKANTTKIEEAIRAYQSGRTTPPLDESSSSQRSHRGMVNLTAYLFQPVPGGGGQAGGDKSSVKAIPATEANEKQVRRLLRAIGSDVEVEMLPDLDVIILRGPDRDVEEVSRIIEQLERLSEETQPVVEVVPLKHVNGEALMGIVTKVQDAVAAGRQGRISIIPLVKPNALLLIGWGDAVKAVKQMLDKLDRPVEPDTQFRTFPLRYAPVAAVRTTVQEFFANRTGLNGKVQVSSDIRTNALVVQAQPQEMSEVAALVEKLDRSESGSVHQTRIFRLKFSLAIDLSTTLQAAISAARGGSGGATAGVAAAGAKSANLELITLDAEGQRIIKSGILSDVQITSDPRLNTIIVTGPAESMGLIEALIHQLDAPVAAAQIKVFRILNGDASSMVLMLRSLLPGGAATVAATATPQLGMVTDEASLTPLRFSIDVRTNSIIAVGSSSDLKIVEALLLKLDGQDVQNRKSEVYRLKNSPARDVATAVNEFLRSKRQVEQAAPGMASPFQQIESEVVVVPEPVSNSLIISATPRFFQEIHDLVEKLDAQPSQVLIQVLIAEVDLTNFDEFGVELGLQSAVLFNRSVLSNVVNNGTTILNATRVPGFNFNNQPLSSGGASLNGASPSAIGSQGLSSFNVGRTNSERGFGGLVLSASSESVSVLLRALKETHSIEILARPQIMSLDNQPAYIQVGKRVPRIAGTALTAATQVNSIVLENVGLILGVTPRISPEGMVVMELDAEKSEMGPQSEGVPVSVSGGVPILSPSINVTTAQTTVSAHSGETIVLGGLITKLKEKSDRHVPLLGDIPVVGNLFGYKSTNNERHELLIIMTPHVVRSGEETDRAKQIEAARMHWCLGDVEQIHGDIGTSSGGKSVRNAPVVYPDDNPRGVLRQPPQPNSGNGSPAAPATPELVPAPGSMPVQPIESPPPPAGPLAPLAPATDVRQPVAIGVARCGPEHPRPKRLHA